MLFVKADQHLLNLACLSVLPYDEKHNNPLKVTKGTQHYLRFLAGSGKCVARFEFVSRANRDAALADIMAMAQTAARGGGTGFLEIFPKAEDRTHRSGEPFPVVKTPCGPRNKNAAYRAAPGGNGDPFHRAAAAVAASMAETLAAQILADQSHSVTVEPGKPVSRRPIVTYGRDLPAALQMLLHGGVKLVDDESTRLAANGRSLIDSTRRDTGFWHPNTAAPCPGWQDDGNGGRRHVAALCPYGAPNCPRVASPLEQQDDRLNRPDVSPAEAPQDADCRGPRPAAGTGGYLATGDSSYGRGRFATDGKGHVDTFEDW